MAYTVILEGGLPWGFRLQGGQDFNDSIKIAKLNPNSKAYNQGVKVGDCLDRINGTSIIGLKLNEALSLIRTANSKLELELRRSDRKKNSSIPEIRINGPPVNGNLSDSDYYYSSCDEESSSSGRGGIIRTNAITSYQSSGSGSGSGHQSDGDQSGSTSDSQSSVVHVVGPYKGPLAEDMKNIANSTSGPGSGEGQANLKTSVWSPFGPNKTRTYKPVSFNVGSAILSGSSGLPTSATSSSYSTYSSSSPSAASASTLSSSFDKPQTGLGNVSLSSHADRNQNFGAIPSYVSSTASHSDSFNGSGPSYSNFNGSGSVIVTSPASSYTSITMSSKKAPEFSPTQKFTLFGAPPYPRSNPGPFSPTITPNSPIKIPSAAEFGLTDSILHQNDLQMSKNSPGSSQDPFILGSPPKSSLRSSSPTKPMYGPSSPTKSSFGLTETAQNIGSPKITTKIPSSPTKSVTFGPVTSLGESSNSHTESPEPQMSFSQTKSLFENTTQGVYQPRMQPISLPSSATAPPQRSLSPFLTPAIPSQTPSNVTSVATNKPQASRPFSPSGVTNKPLSPRPFSPGAVTNKPLSPRPFSPGGATNKPLSPRPFSPGGSPSKLSRPFSPTRPLSPVTPPKPRVMSPTFAPTIVPKSPTNKSKGLSMFLHRQEKYNDPEDSMGDFTDSEEPNTSSRPKSPSIPRILKQVPTSPIVGRAMPMKVESNGREGPFNEDLSLNNNSINSMTSIKPLSSTSNQPRAVSSPKPGLWMPGQDLPSIENDLKEKERQKEKDREAEVALRNAPSKWSPTGPEDGKKDFRSIKLEPTSLKAPETQTRSESPVISPEDSFAWKPTERASTVSSSTVTMTTTTTMATKHTPSTSIYTSHNGSISHPHESHTGLPLYQSPTITLLQKSRELAKAKTNFEVPSDVRTLRVEENQIPDSAILVGTKESVEGNQKHYDTYYVLPGEEKETKTQKVVGKTKSRYEGIGPTDEKTGIPIIPRGSVDEKMHRDWYKRMYKSLHKQDKREESNAYKPTYVFPEEDTESELDDALSTMSLDRPGGYGKKAYIIPDAKYREEKFKVQPRSIENYEPGYSSIAFREARVSPTPISTQQKERPKTPVDKPVDKPDKSHSSEVKSDKNFLYNPPIEKPGQFSKYTYSDTERDIRKKDRALSPTSDVETRQAYRKIQKGGDIPYEGLRFPVPPKKDPRQSSTANELRQRHSMSGSGQSPTGSWDRRRRDEEAIRRKQEMHRVTSEERRKRMEIEMRANAARRHDYLSDFIQDKCEDKYWLKLAGIDDEQKESPSQKSPIPLDRYDDPPDVPPLQKPKKKMSNQYKGRGKALYNFRAQNTRELSFRKNDIIYIVRQLDKNWYEGEHHGLVGIFPINYVEVLTSLDEARTAAIMREGQAVARFTFNAQTGLELSFKKGDKISLTRRIDENWFEGHVGHKHGIFPVGYVEIYTEPDTPLSSYAPTPATGSPGQLSPVSTISNGPAPTIPSAPISPHSSIDLFDFNQPYGFGNPPSAGSTLQRGAGQHSYGPDYSLEALMMRPSSALAGRSDGYDSMPRDRYNRPSSAVPFTDYYGKSLPRDSGFYSSTESRGSRQVPKPDLVSRSMSDSYEARIQKNKPAEQFSIRNEDEPKYPKYRALYNYQPQNPDELELKEGDVVLVMEKCDDDWYVGTSERTKEFGTFPGNYVRTL